MKDPREMLREAETSLATAQAAVAQWEAMVRAIRGAIKDAKPLPRADALAVPAANGVSGLAQLPSTAAAEIVLTEANGPLPIRDIITRMQARGHRPEMDQGRLYTRLFTAMVRQPHRFQKLKGAKFDLARRAVAS